MRARAGQGSLVALSRGWAPRLKPPGFPFRRRALHAGCSCQAADFELAGLGPVSQERGREALALLCLLLTLAVFPAAGWHSPLSEIERLIIII